MHVKRIKTFLNDFFECFPPKPARRSLLAFEDENQTKMDLNLDKVMSWPVEASFCPKMSEEDYVKYGTGVYILKILESITLCRPPNFDQKEGYCTIPDIYTTMTLELLTAKFMVQ